MHILFLLDYYHPHLGGTETVFSNIIQRLEKKGYIIDIVTSRHDASLPREEKIGNKTIHRIGHDRISFMLVSTFFVYRLLKQKPSIQIIHSTTYGAAIPSSIVSKLQKKPVIVTVHEIFGKLRKHYKKRPQHLFYSFFEKCIFAFAYDAYHCVSYYTYNSIRLVYGCNDKKLHMIHNGVDTSRNRKNLDPIISKKIRTQYRINTYTQTLLYYGHSGKSKGLDYLIQALPILAKQKDRQIILNIIDAQRDSIVRKKIQDMRLPNVLLLKGMKKKDLQHLVANVDAVIAPSLSEGFGSVHTETSQIGTTLITTPIGPLPEVLHGKVIRIQPQSSQSIIQAVHKLSTTNTKEATNTIPQQYYFSRDTTVEKLEKLYTSLTSSSQVREPKQKS